MTLDEMKEAALNLANEKHRPLGERRVVQYLDDTPFGIYLHTRSLTVTAMYSERMERMTLYNPAWSRDQRPRIVGYSYQLFDAERGRFDMIVQLSEAAARRVLEEDWLPPAIPPQEFDDPLADDAMWDEIYSRDALLSRAQAETRTMQEYRRAGSDDY